MKVKIKIKCKYLFIAAILLTISAASLLIYKHYKTENTIFFVDYKENAVVYKGKVFHFSVSLKGYDTVPMRGNIDFLLSKDVKTIYILVDPYAHAKVAIAAFDIWRVLTFLNKTSYVAYTRPYGNSTTLVLSLENATKETPIIFINITNSTEVIVKDYAIIINAEDLNKLDPAVAKFCVELLKISLNP